MLSVLLGAIPVILAIPVVMSYFGKILNLLVQVSEVLQSVTDALGDNNLTPEEIEEIKKEAKDVVLAVKAFKKDE